MNFLRKFFKKNKNKHVIHDSLPINVKIASVNTEASKLCPRCNLVEETSIHAIRNCPKARDILVLGNVDGILLEKPWDACIDWLEEMMHFLDKIAF